MVATAMTAVVMMVLIQWIAIEEPEHVWPLLVVAAFASLMGWVVTASLLILGHALRRKLWRLEAGEWLMLCLANVTVMWFALLLLERMARFNVLNHTALDIAIQFLRHSMPGEMAALYLVGAVLWRRQIPWSAALAAGALTMWSFHLLYGIPEWLFRAIVVTFTCMSITMIVWGVVVDRGRRRKRHWIHWSGTGISILAACALVAIVLVYPF